MILYVIREVCVKVAEHTVLIGFEHISENSFVRRPC